MMEIYLSRHGETIWNQKNIFCGHSDIPISEKGKKQAEELGNKLLDEGITMILTSPLLRAKQTADIIGQILDVPILEEHLLIEQDFGMFEELSMKDEESVKYRTNFFQPFPEGESVVMVVYRVMQLIKKLTKEYRDQKILMVSHGAFCRIFHACMYKVSNAEYQKILFQNCQTQKYKIHTGMKYK